MRRILTKFITTALLFVPAGCATMGTQYSSNQNGAVSCEDFPIQSTRKDLRADRPNSCWVRTSDQVQYMGSSYRRTFESESGYTNALLQVAGTNTVLLHRDTRGLINTFDQVRKEGAEWEDLPSLVVNGRKYTLQKFTLYKAKHECIGYATYGGNPGTGYNSIFSGYSCKPQGNGFMEITDLKRDLEPMTIRMH